MVPVCTKNVQENQKANFINLYRRCAEVVLFYVMGYDQPPKLNGGNDLIINWSSFDALNNTATKDNLGKYSEE